MSGLLTDLRHAVRTLRRSPAYTALCILALALGIAANGAIFSFVEALMLRPLPYPEAERLAVPQLTAAGGRFGDGPMSWSYPKLETFAREQRVFESVAGFTGDSANLAGRGEPERVQLEMVSPSYFEVLGVRPIAGRALVGDDIRADAPLVAMVGEGMWRRRFGGDPAAIGRTVTLDKVPVTIVGVAPIGFRGLTGDAELWVPVTAAALLWYPEALSNPHNHFLDAIGKLRPGVTPVALAAEMERAGEVVATAHPAGDGGVWSAAAQPLEDVRRDATVRRALLVLLAIRLAIGATGARLLRQLLAESLLLAAVGCGAGLLLAAWVVRAVTTLRPEAFGDWGGTWSELGDLSAAGVGGQVVVYCAALAALTALVCGVAPALIARRLQLGEGLRAGGASTSGWGGPGGGWHGGSRGLLVACQMAVATVLLLGAGLLLRTLWTLQRVDLGYRAEGVLTFAVSPAGSDVPDGRAGAALHAALLERLAALPGVAGAAVGTCAPTSPGCNSSNVKLVDGVRRPWASPTFVGTHMVSPDYFSVLGVQLIAGRPFAASDRAGAPRVAIVNRAAAALLWPGQEALGHRLQTGMGDFAEDEQAEVVGVVADVRYSRVEEVAQPAVYLPDAQAAWPMTTVLLRAEGDPLALVPAAREAVRAVDGELPIYRVATLEERIGVATARARLASLLLAAFAALAVGLAAIGVYGVLAQVVLGRRRELGLRLALGARREEVQRMVLRQGMAVALLGAMVGLAVGLPATGALGKLLYEVEAHDPLTFLLAPLALVVAALLACLLPARRAAALDPALVLRQD
jgi:putative ABC transport system permease protein